jgi:hypothetical protein
MILDLEAARTKGTIFGFRKPHSLPEPLFTFRYPNLGYSIAIIPDTPFESAKFKAKAKRRHQSLRDHARDEILCSLTWANLSSNDSCNTEIRINRR